MKDNCEKQQSCRKSVFNGHGSWGSKSCKAAGAEFTSVGALERMSISLQKGERGRRAKKVTQEKENFLSVLSHPPFLTLLLVPAHAESVLLYVMFCSRRL